MTGELGIEFSRYMEINSVDKATSDLDWLCAQADYSDVTEGCGALSFDLIRRAIDDRVPLSLVRVGDGEGNILAGSRTDFPSLNAHSETNILRMMFGSESFEPHQVDRMRTGLIEAVVGADILGVSDVARLERMRRRLMSGQTKLDLRGLSGSIESIVGVRRIVEGSGVRPAALVSNLAHRYLGGYYRSIFSGLDFLGYVAPYDLDALLLSSFDVDQVEGYRIPNQDSNGVAKGSKWFPAQYDALLDRVRVPHTGAVFVVAAGVLGKSICHHIKALGGIAIDVGSMVDVWAGKGVRNYHDAAFIAAHRLD
ncbi:hypothetical protein [uncultured Brevundimonas sp.]|uniref:hypothetical protein n=1 Tax=uncultured Brevundimonas sp. TaxID=213418 RepID=UPI0025FF0CE1|nr:hypothetical protein [uncultured Brevundimonas sp.]